MTKITAQIDVYLMEEYQHIREEIKTFETYIPPAKQSRLPPGNLIHRQEHKEISSTTVYVICNKTSTETQETRPNNFVDGLA